MSHPCGCALYDGITFCPRHSCEKTAHWRKLCREREDYRRQWDQGIGLGQLTGLRCDHRSTPDQCAFCAAKIPVTPEPQRSTQDFTIAGRVLSTREESGERCVWPAGLILAEYIVRHPPKGAVVDLGCGTGIVGLAALSVGCHVTFLDRDPQATALAQENAQANGFTDFNILTADWKDDQSLTWSNVVGSELLWDRDDRTHLLRWLAIHWNLQGVCLLSFSGGKIDNQLFESSALHSKAERSDLEMGTNHYASYIYEVTA